MIIDQICLSGDKSYLLYGNEIDLSQPRRIGKSHEIVEGNMVRVNGLHLILESNDLIDLFKVVTREKPLISIKIKKEIFPGLFSDPHARRVHTIVGPEDLSKGYLHCCKVMEIEGKPTLVSTGSGPVTWRSLVYHLKYKARFVAAAWELASTRLTAQDFTYDIKLYHLRESDENFRETYLIREANPSLPRVAPKLINIEDVSSYYVELTAFNISYEPNLFSQHDEGPTLKNIGCPLLRSVNLLEKVESDHNYFSLNELLSDAIQWRFIPPAQLNPTQISLELPISALLSYREYISMEVDSNKFDYVEARLDAMEMVRPPKGVDM